MYSKTSALCHPFTPSPWRVLMPEEKSTKSAWPLQLLWQIALKTSIHYKPQNLLVKQNSICAMLKEVKSPVGCEYTKQLARLLSTKKMSLETMIKQ